VKRAAISVSLNVVNNALPTAVGAAGNRLPILAESRIGARLVPGETSVPSSIAICTTSWPRSGDEVQ
jgi:hypothetical protein